MRWFVHILVLILVVLNAFGIESTHHYCSKNGTSKALFGIINIKHKCSTKVSCKSVQEDPCCTTTVEFDERTDISYLTDYPIDFEDQHGFLFHDLRSKFLDVIALHSFIPSFSNSNTIVSLRCGPEWTQSFLL